MKSTAIVIAFGTITVSQLVVGIWTVVLAVEKGGEIRTSC